MEKNQENPGRILIVDDDIDLLMLLERTLKKHKYIIETAASLPEAEELVEEFQPDLILLDININGADGRQLSWKVKNGSVYPVKVLLMSGYDVSTSRAVLFGADEVLAKPLEVEYLLKRIETQLGKGDEFSPLTVMGREENQENT